MTLRRPTRAGGKAGPALLTRELPTLRAFARGYLHEDFAVEHGDPALALAAFIADASIDERAALRDECEWLLRTLASMRLRDVRAVFVEALGSAWRPASVAQVAALLRAAVAPPSNP
ncbi:MAG: contact-dependent growth inhibition system immunity protein [Vicinamibacterales bacterium]